MYIDVNELELNVATKNRSVSLDVHNKRRAEASTLPSLPSSTGTPLPNLSSSSMPHPTTVLPHSEPLTEDLKQQAAYLIDLFNLDIVTCFYSQFWSSRMAALDKIAEQIPNLDPNQRDAMSTEINKKNLAVEDCFKHFLKFVEEGVKDPVLKIYLGVLEVVQRAMPVFFRWVKGDEIRKGIMPVVACLIKKMSDLKVKVREATSHFLLYLSHQSPIGPESMFSQVLLELLSVLESSSSSQSSIAANLGNSHMVSSCLQLLTQFQSQSQLITSSAHQLYPKTMQVVNLGLKH